MWCIMQCVGRSRWFITKVAFFTVRRRPRDVRPGRARWPFNFLMVDASVILVSIFINLLHPCRNSFVVEDQLFLICLFDWGWKTDKNLKSGFWRNLVCRIAGWYCCFWYSWPLGRGRQRGTNFRSKIPLSSDVVAQQAYLAQWQFRCLRVKPIPQCKGSRLRPPTSICMVACTTQPCQWGPQSPNVWNTLITQSYWIWQVDLLPPPRPPCAWSTRLRCEGEPGSQNSEWRLHQSSFH